jgi:homoserine kinase
MVRHVVVEAPASSANLGCGFDLFALALARPEDRLKLEATEAHVTLAVRGSEQLAEKPEKNVVRAVASAMIAEYGVRSGVAMTLTKGVPVGAGLGSSAASSVAAAVGIDRLFALDLSNRELIRWAGLGEKVASGTAHYDNVAASLAGGFVAIQKDHDFVRMEPPKQMALCLATPAVKLPKEKTKYARSLLPKEVPMERAVAVTRAVSMMVHGFAVGSLKEIGDAMAESFIDDRRAVMIPGFDGVKRAAISRGAAGVCISGAGPSLLAVCEKRSSEKVLGAMVRAFGSQGVKSSGFVTRPGRGCAVIEK